jgi:rhomboid protease GluP
MAWGISPRSTAVIPLGDYNAGYYLTLLYHAFQNLGWQINYFNHDGIIAYTPISWASYAEEVSVRIENGNALFKSECVGYQFFFYDYGKNEKNLRLLYGELEYVEYHLQNNLAETTQELMDSVPENQFMSMLNPPMGAKEQLRTFLSAFTPQKNYFVTPLLVLVNVAVYIVTFVTTVVALVLLMVKIAGTDHTINVQNVYLMLGFNHRAQVLHGEVWRLLTSIFLHFSFLHIAGNMIVLIYIGSLIEIKLGRRNYLLLYICCGICASMVSVMWNDAKVSGGASGAIFGLFGILLALLSTPFYDPAPKRALLISTGIFVAYNIIPVGKQIDHAAHFGGLIAGYLLGWLAYLGLKYSRQNLVMAGYVALTVLFTGMCIAFAPQYDYPRLQKLMVQHDSTLKKLNKCFYGKESLGMPHAERVTMLQQDAVPQLKKLANLATQIDGLTLPSKQKQIAHIRSAIMLQECTIFKLLQQEVQDDNYQEHRSEINGATSQINALRIKWGKIDDSEE